MRSDNSASTESPSADPANQLTPAEQRLVQELKQLDREVRAHEQAHISVGADLVRGGPSFTYQTGPDNQRYAIGGEVSIDTSPGRTPEETIPKAQHIRAAALAPAEPSPQDQSVAARAGLMESEARADLAVQKRTESADTKSTRFYLVVGQSDEGNTSVGSGLDLFA